MQSDKNWLDKELECDSVEETDRALLYRLWRTAHPNGNPLKQEKHAKECPNSLVAGWIQTLNETIARTRRK